jgi:MEMO1 family protein
MSPVGSRAPVRPAAVAGSFYPGDADELTAMVDTLLEQARLRASQGASVPARVAPVALVAPHAGYMYSGPVAASAYQCLRNRPVHRVAVLGPAHHVALAGIAVPAAAAFATPIGAVPVEVDTCAALAERHECVTVDDRPHRPEHSIEVQLPFLQSALADSWTCVPLVVGATEPEMVADVLDTLCIGGDMLPVVSTDLSHYLDQLTAQRRDRHTAQAVMDLDAAEIGPADACGAFALRGLLHWATRHGLEARLLHQSTSADAGGDPGRVVGYAAFAVLAPGRRASSLPNSASQGRRDKDPERMSEHHTHQTWSRW